MPGSKMFGSPRSTRCPGRRSARDHCPPDEITGRRIVLEPKTLMGFAAMIAFTVAANLTLKLGAGVPPAERVLLGVLGWKSAAGLALFGCSGIIYALLLRRVPLTIAQAFPAARFVGVVISAGPVLPVPRSLL